VDDVELLADHCREIERYVASSAFTPAVALLLDVCNTLRPDERTRAITLSRRYYAYRRPGQGGSGESIEKIESDLLAMVAGLRGGGGTTAARAADPPRPAPKPAPTPPAPSVVTPLPRQAPPPQPARPVTVEAPRPPPKPAKAEPPKPVKAEPPKPVKAEPPKPVKAEPPKPVKPERLVADAARAAKPARQPARVMAPSAPPGVAVDVVGVTKSYRTSEFHLNDFSLQLRDGAITALVGRNGSGKTTLLRIVIGDLAPDSGRVVFGFAPPPTDWLAVKPQIGYVAQRAEFWRGSLKTHLLYVSAMNSPERRADDEDVEWHLHRYGLLEYAEATWSELSGGYRTRAQLVRALLAKPKLLVLDEPLAYLDIAAQDDFLSDLRRIASDIGKRIPILITSQHIAEIEGIADTIVVLDRGACRFAGSIAQLFAEADAYYYEIAPRIDEGEAIRALADLGIDEVRPLSNGNLLVFRRVKEPPEVFAGIAQAFKGRLRSIRDITASTERMLRDRRDG
jgi:ABC-type multidrug transport system ATPase subunit